MIKPFEKNDLGYFLPNEFSDPDRVLHHLLDPAYTVQTMWHGGMAAAILAFSNYWGRNWLGFFLIARDFPPRLARELRAHIAATMDEKDALRLQTDSVAVPCLDRWHRFLGFTLEGCRRQLIYGKDYNCWARLREGA